MYMEVNIMIMNIIMHIVSIIICLSSMIFTVDIFIVIDSMVSKLLMFVVLICLTLFTRLIVKQLISDLKMMKKK